MSIIESVYKYIGTHRLIQTGDHLLIGVSGGGDSMALVHVLFSLRHRLGVTISVAHFNHRLRWGADQDQAFVKKAAEKYQVSFYTDTWRHAGIKGSIEEKAREKRLHFFARVSKRSGANKIVLAHTKDDQAETVLMRLIRGSGLKGLKAMSPQNQLHGLTIIRPLLALQKFELTSFCQQYKIAFREDPTNQSTDFTRNKIRLQLLPLLAKEYNPNIVSVLANLAESATDDYEFLEETVKALLPKFPRNPQVVQIKLSLFKKRSPAVLKLLIRSAIEALQGDTRRLTYQHIIDIINFIELHPPSSVIHLPQQVTIRKTSTQVIFKK